MTIQNYNWDSDLMTDLEALVPGLYRGMHANDAIQAIVSEIMRLKGGSLNPRFVAQESGLYHFGGGRPKYLFKGEWMEVPDGAEVTRVGGV